MSFISWCDSNWASDVDNCRSINGYLFQHANGLFFWQSRKQSTIALSTIEVKYMATTSTTKETLWIYQLMFDLGFPIFLPIQLYY